MKLVVFVCILLLLLIEDAKINFFVHKTLLYRKALLTPSRNPTYNRHWQNILSLNICQIMLNTFFWVTCCYYDPISMTFGGFLQKKSISHKEPKTQVLGRRVGIPTSALGLASPVTTRVKVAKVHLNMCHPQRKLNLRANSELFSLITHLGSSKSDRILKIRVRFGYSWEHILYVPKVWSYSSLQHP